jgi:hypothetical protein
MFLKRGQLLFLAVGLHVGILINQARAFRYAYPSFGCRFTVAQLVALPAPQMRRRPSFKKGPHNQPQLAPF